MEISSEVMQTKQRVEAELLARPGVTAVDVGFKEVGGQLTDQIAIRVHVVQKRARVAAAERVPTEIDGVVTDVLERQYELQVASQAVDVSLLADTTHYSTVQGGISMGPSRVINGFVYAGTLGAVVIDNTNNQHAALTNFHVACVDSGWHVGDRMVQPSRIDTGVPPGDEFGGIVRATLSANVDGAVVSIDPGRANSCTIAEIGNVTGTTTATLGMPVRKRGRTTGLTYGSVDGLNASVNVDYGDGLGVHLLTNQVSIHADTTRNAMFSDHGDSGSVIVDDTGHVVALLFAGAGANTMANPIAAVLSELNVSMCIGKAPLKDIVDNKNRIKDFKDHIKDKDKDHKELLKDGIKDFKEAIKEVKDVRDTIPKGFEVPIPDPGPLQPPGVGGSMLEQRLAGLEQRLGQLTSFIESGLRPELPGANQGDEQGLAQLRAALEQQAADAAAAKAELDNLG
jgi:hypothetical protein